MGMDEWWSQCKPQLVVIDNWEICFRCILFMCNGVPLVSFFPVFFNTISD